MGQPGQAGRKQRGSCRSIQHSRKSPSHGRQFEGDFFLFLWDNWVAMGIKWGQRGRRGRSREPSLVPSPLLACRRSHRTCPAYRFCPTCDTSCPLDPLAAHMTHLQHTWPTCGTLALPGPLEAHLQPTWSTWPTCGPLAAHLPQLHPTCTTCDTLDPLDLLRDVDQVCHVCHVCHVCCKSKCAKCASTLAIGHFFRKSKCAKCASTLAIG